MITGYPRWDVQAVWSDFSRGQALPSDFADLRDLGELLLYIEREQHPQHCGRPLRLLNGQLWWVLDAHPSVKQLRLPAQWRLNGG